jgi:holo-[acyl-carrier protein] synthase
MIYGIGVDLVEIDRMERAITRSGPRLVERLYTADERAYCGTKRFPYPCFAARFACKEAFLKALGTGLRKHMRWRDIEVRRDPLGKPFLHLHGYLRKRCTAAGIRRVHLSLSHSASHAVAQVVLET